MAFPESPLAPRSYDLRCVSLDYCWVFLTVFVSVVELVAAGLVGSEDVVVVVRLRSSVEVEGEDAGAL
jgi:hypothetical protein